MSSAAKHRYRPRIIDGQPIPYPGVQTQLIFELDGIDETAPSAPDTHKGDTIIITGSLAPAGDA